MTTQNERMHRHKQNSRVEDHGLVVIESKARDNQEQTHDDLHFLERASATRTPAEASPEWLAETTPTTHPTRALCDKNVRSQKPPPEVKTHR